MQYTSSLLSLPSIFQNRDSSIQKIDKPTSSWCVCGPPSRRWRECWAISSRCTINNRNIRLRIARLYRLGAEYCIFAMSDPIRSILPALLSNDNRTRREAEAVYTGHLEGSTVPAVGVLLEVFSSPQEVCLCRWYTPSCIAALTIFVPGLRTSPSAHCAASCCAESSIRRLLIHPA